MESYTANTTTISKINTWLFNPFKYIAGWNALILGMAIIFITDIVSHFLWLHWGNVIGDMTGVQNVAPSGLLALVISQTVAWLFLSTVLYLFGRTLSPSSIRFIDVAGTISLARYPSCIAVIIAKLFLHDIKTPEVLHAIHTTPDLLGILLLMPVWPFYIWTMILMYKAYTISANIKGRKAVLSFIVSLVATSVFTFIIVKLH